MLSSAVFNNLTSRSILHEALVNQTKLYKQQMEDDKVNSSDKLMVRDLMALCYQMLFELERDSSYKIQDLRV